MECCTCWEHSLTAVADVVEPSMTEERNGYIVDWLNDMQTKHTLEGPPPQTYENGVNPSCPMWTSSSSDGSNIIEAKKKSDFENKKLNRGISRATDNVNLVSQARSELLADSSDQEYCMETPVHTFILPDLTGYADNFRTFLVKDLIALSTQISLEQANRLNWWTAYCQRLWPLSTSGDGNCLLHAASLGMWGFHDRLLTLRKALHSFLTQSPRREALWRRWRRQQSVNNAQAGLVYSEIEWRQEWNAIVNMASTEPRLRRLSVQSEQGSERVEAIYSSLEEIHVLALAHVLKRPIVVIAETVLKDMNGEDLAPIQFGGVYLPLECDATDCHRSPLLLAYDGGHFSALVSMDTPGSTLSSAVPLTDINGDLLPIQFSVDPGSSGNWTEALDLSYCQNIDILSTYLDIIRIDPQTVSPAEDSKNSLLGSIGKSVGQKLRLKLSRNQVQRQGKAMLCAALHTDHRLEYHDAMIKNYLDTARQRFELVQNSNEVPLDAPPRYQTGKSYFYTEADSSSHESVSHLTPVKLNTKQDSTLYLSNSTFYQPSLPCQTETCNFFGNPQTQNYCSKCYRQLIEDQFK